MKLRLTYFLLLTILFLKGYGHVATTPQQPKGHSSLQQGKILGADGFVRHHNQVSLLLPSLFVDDSDDNEDDDEYTVSGKKQPVSNGGLAHYHIYTLGFFQNPYQQRLLPNRYLITPLSNKYILLRTLRI